MRLVQVLQYWQLYQSIFILKEEQMMVHKAFLGGKDVFALTPNGFGNSFRKIEPQAVATLLNWSTLIGGTFSLSTSNILPAGFVLYGIF